MHKVYILIWIHEEEKWYYFENNFDESQFPDGYVDYIILVNNDGIIVSDSFKADNVGKVFADIYDIEMWKI